MTPEQKTTLAICEWMKLQHPLVFQHLVKIQNEGKHTVGGFMLALRMGLHQGASDLFIAWPTSKYPGLWMEIKPDKWKGPFGKKQLKHHESQMEFINKMNARGYFAKMIIGTDEGIDLIKFYLND